LAIGNIGIGIGIDCGSCGNSTEVAFCVTIRTVFDFFCVLANGLASLMDGVLSDASDLFASIGTEVSFSDE